MYFGAALTGVGVEDLLHAIPKLLPSVEGDRTGPASGTVFKIERGPSGEKIAFVRMFSGTLRTRDRLQLGVDVETVTAIDVFDRGTTRRRPATHAGEIAKVHGLSTSRIGDTFGPNAHTFDQQAFAPPTLETAIVPRREGQKRAVFDALTELAEQDPLINLRQDDSRQELYLSLYGEVQKEIVAQTLAGTTDSTSPSDRRRRSASSDRTASAQPSNCSVPAGRRATHSWRRSAWRSRHCRPTRA